MKVKRQKQYERPREGRFFVCGFYQMTERNSHKRPNKIATNDRILLKNLQNPIIISNFASEM